MEPEQINPTPVTQPAVVIEEQITKKLSKLLVYLLFILIILGLASWAGVYLKKENVNEVQIVNETDNWKTYRNEEYGFEFKYPSDWEVSTSTQTVIINSKTNAKKIADFEMRNMDTDAGPRDDIAVLLPSDRIIMNLDEYISYEKDKDFFLDTKPITVGGLSGYDFTEIGFSGVYTILLDSKSNFYEIIFGYRGSRGELSDVENKILSTFNFIGNLVKVTGYYTSEIREAWEEKKICDEFVVTGGDSEFIKEYSDAVKRGNTVNQINESGRLVLEIELSNINPSLRDRIKSSTLSSPIEIVLSEKIPEGKSAPVCFSFFNIIK